MADLPFTSWRRRPGGAPDSLAVDCRTVLRCPSGSRGLAALLAAWGALARVVLVLPVLLAAALPLAVAAVSGLVKRPRSGLALTQRTRPRSSCSEEDEPQPGRSVVRESAYQERHSCWPAGVGCS
jgi:hypothetical protein